MVYLYVYLSLSMDLGTRIASLHVS